MKIAIIAPSPVPYEIGGAEKLWWGLLRGIHDHSSHQAELIKLPSPERTFPELIASYQAFSALDLRHFDLVISTKYPAWMIQHHNHVVYLQHRLRGLYDTYPAHMKKGIGPLPAAFDRLLALLNAQPDRGALPELFAEITSLCETKPDCFAFPGGLTRAIIHHLDGIGLATRSIRRYLAISDTVARRQDYFPAAAEVEVVHHPEFIQTHPDKSQTARQTGAAHPLTIFTVSRLDRPKRLDLLIRAFIQVKGDVRLCLAGTGPEEDSLKELAASDPRIEFLGWCTDTEIGHHYRDCLFVPFVPADEDYGLITVEAMRAGKPVLTTTDAGGVNELVNHQVNGLVAQPTPKFLAKAMQQLIDNPEQTRAMGQAARDTVAPITWRSTIAALVQQRPVIVVVTTFPVFPPQGGGQSRIFHLYRHLSRYADIILLTLTHDEQRAGEIVIQPGLRELRVVKSPRQKSRERRLARQLKASVDDIAAIDYTRLTPDYGSKLTTLCKSADLVILSHPYLYHEVKAVWTGPIWYEAHNVEADMKRDILKEALVGNKSQARKALNRVKAVEGASCVEAQLVLAVSREDGQRLQQLYGAMDVTVVENGVDLDATPFVSIQERRVLKNKLGLNGTFTALFMGSWHGPNIEALAHIEAMASQCPSMDFLIMGSVCHVPGIKSEKTNIHFLGLLTEAEKSCILGAVDVAINPVTSGSGTNLKMLDYGAAGVLILTTPFGNRGLQFVADEHLLLAEMEEFPRCLLAIQKNGVAHYENLLVKARSLVEKQYAWYSIADKLAGFLA